MNEPEVRKLFMLIQNVYNSFFYDDVKVLIWQDLLSHTPFELAQRNLKAHMLNPDEKFPPTPGILTRLPSSEARPYIPNAEETRRLIAQREGPYKNPLPFPEPIHLQGRFKIEPPREHTTS